MRFQTRIAFFEETLSAMEVGSIPAEQLFGKIKGLKLALELIESPAITPTEYYYEAADVYALKMKLGWTVYKIDGGSYHWNFKSQKWVHNHLADLTQDLDFFRDEDWAFQTLYGVPPL